MPRLYWETRPGFHQVLTRWQILLDESLEGRLPVARFLIRGCTPDNDNTPRESLGNLNAVFCGNVPMIGVLNHWTRTVANECNEEGL